MTRLAAILLCAWVLWHEIQGSNGTHIETVGAFLSTGYEVCMADAKAKADSTMRVLRSAGNTDVARHDSGSVASLIARMESGIFAFRYMCLPDTIDPRGPK